MNIICFGDSNTYGYDPRSYLGGRYDADNRWVDILAAETGWAVRNLGENGRGIPAKAPDFPTDTDLLIVMLGTNDLRFTDAWGAAEGAAALVKKVRLYNHMEESTHIFPGKPRILLIAPILAHADLDNRDVIGRWRSYPQKSRGFAAAYAAVAAELGVDFLNAAAYADPSAVDGIHMEASGHAALGEAVARKVREMFAGE